jgi:long-chain acyl-CoA synthetase
MNANLACNLIATAQRTPERTAIMLDATRMSYAELDEATARLAGFLRARGIGPGDRVGLMLPNVPEFAIVYYGILRVGAVVVPMNVQFKQREVAYYLDDSGARIVFAWAGCEPAESGAREVGAECVVLEPGGLARKLATSAPAPRPAQCDGRDTAVILYTSGTTGKPKGALLTHANLGGNAAVACGLFGLNEESVFLGVLPLFHSFGQTCALNATVAAGATLTLVSRFEPAKVLGVIERDRVSIFAGVPTMYGALLNHRERARFNVGSLRLCVSGGAALPVEMLHAFEAAFGCVILEGYGLSETSPIASFNSRDRERKAGSIGQPVDGVEMKIVNPQGEDVPQGEVGEILIRGHNVMKGYWQRLDATAEAITPDGWFHSGDLGRMDDEGYFYIVDRKKDMIIRGGFNVYPREIEEVLYQHPAVREAAVVAIPHPLLGEEVGAAIVTVAGAATSPEEIKQFVKEQVAGYKYPRHIWFVDELPKTATGKILKRSILPPAELLGAGSSASDPR